MFVPNFAHFTLQQLRQRQALFIEILLGFACSVPYTSPVIFLVHNFCVIFFRWTPAEVKNNSTYLVQNSE